MTQAAFFPTMPEPGAMEFLPEVTTGWTHEEAYALLTGKMPYIDVIIAAADVQTGAMIAFIPSSDDLAELVLDAEDAEPLDQLHCTAMYLGDADEYDEDMQRIMHEAVQAFAASQPVIRGDVFGYSVFGPDTPDACLVADVGGVDLEDAQNALVELCDDLEMGIPDQLVPYRPHVTLAYTEDPRTLMTDELMAKTGPITFDRVRVAFAGVSTDYPLGAVTAAAFEPFHLAGQHDQATHGRGGASPGESLAADRLAHGKTLDESDPEQARVAGAVRTWITGEQAGANMQVDIQEAMVDPTLDTDGAAFTRTVAAAPAVAPTLYRGMADVPAHKIPAEGDTFDLGPTSFSRSKKALDEFSQPQFGDLGAGTRVHVTVQKKSRAIDVSQYAPKKYKHEQEHVGLGRYTVTSRRERRTTVTAKDGRKRDVLTVELEITQVDDGRPTTFSSARPRVIPISEQGL